ncbi:MAG: hypothetical protein KGH98_01040 [Candidatus Micrarchaeota archaeon]|nr:hypothetical protein [Candidatus Micrarchaeota archaeon]
MTSSMHGKIYKECERTWGSIKHRYSDVSEKHFKMAYKILHGIGNPIDLSCILPSNPRLAMCIVENFPFLAARCRAGAAGLRNRGAGGMPEYTSTPILQDAAIHKDVAKIIVAEPKLWELANKTACIEGTVAGYIARKHPDVMVEKNMDSIIDELSRRGRELTIRTQESALGDPDRNKPGYYL